MSITFAEALAACREQWGDPNESADEAAGHERATWDRNEWSYLLLMPGRLASWDAGMGHIPDEDEVVAFHDAASLAAAIDAFDGYLSRRRSTR